MSTNGWFDAFRENGDPAWFGDNRTPVVFDLQIYAIGAVFLIFLMAFLIVLPGIRYHKCASALCIFLSIFVGAVIMISLYHPNWHEGEVQIYAPFRAFSTERMNAILGVKIGLKHANITLKGVPSHDNQINKFDGLKYNERVELLNRVSMHEEQERSLRKGLPYPILKVIEYLSIDRGGFVWGRQYRLCGYYTYCLLWTAFACWIVQIVLLCFVPHYFCVVTSVVGVLTIAADLLYIVCLPKHLQIPFPSVNDSLAILELHLSTCFYLTLTAGVISTVFGIILYYLETKTSYTLKTCMSCSTDECCAVQHKSKHCKYDFDELTISVSPASTKCSNCPSLDQRF
uniref:DUOXA-like protein C06E1.3 n=1 Tax=Syphacia muris TaxID=451379 RepID=A0A158R5A6_9BILA